MINILLNSDKTIKDALDDALDIYSTKFNKYLDEEGNIFPTRQNYTPHLLVGSGNVNFSVNDLGNVNDSIYRETELPDLFKVMKEIVKDEYASKRVRQVFVDKKKNYIFSLNSTDIIVIFGDVNNNKEKLLKMKKHTDIN